VTGYFDEYARCVQDADPYEGPNNFETLERELVADVTLVAEAPGLPQRYRRKIHALVRGLGVATAEKGFPGYDPETHDAHRQQPAQLGSDLHSLFHDIARTVPGLTDYPTSYRMRVDTRGSDYRAAMHAGTLEALLVLRTQVEMGLRLLPLARLEALRASLFYPRWDRLDGLSASEHAEGILLWAGLDADSLEAVVSGIGDVVKTVDRP